MAEEFRKKGVNMLLGPVVSPLGRILEGGRNWEGDRHGLETSMSVSDGFQASALTHTFLEHWLAQLWQQCNRQA